MYKSNYIPFPRSVFFASLILLKNSEHKEIISLEINGLVGRDDRSTNFFAGLKVKIDFDPCYNSLSEVM